MTRVFDPARRERERLLAIEQRAQARAEASEVLAGVTETVALSEARGSAFETPERARARNGPYRRQPGLDWLARKGRLSPDQKAAGERYGACYRRAKSEGSIPSTLDVKPRSSAPGGTSLNAVLARAEGTAQAAAKLVAYRRQLLNQTDLITVCDLICGQELTPREAADCDREAGRLEAVLGVALDILARRPSSEVERNKFSICS
jgi:hypothetical protein